MKLIVSFGLIAVVAIVAANPEGGSLKVDSSALLRGELYNQILIYHFMITTNQN